MPDIIITPSTGKLEFIDNSAQTIRRHSFTLDHSDGLVLDAPLSAAAISAPLNVINVTVNNSNANYPFVLAQSGETGAKNLLMDGAGGTYNPFTNTATIDISGNSATTTLASNSTNLGGVAAASYVTLTDTQTLTNKTITGTFTGNLTGTGSWATNAINAVSATTATNATQLNGQAASYYTNIPARLGYTPVNQAGDTIAGNLTVNGNFAVNGSVTAFSASNIYITSSNLTVTDNILLMNALSPYQRYAGIQMYDSGSSTLSQLLWDGDGDYFFLTGSSVNGKIITGPDGQTNLSSNYVPKATAGYKLGNSLIYDNGTNVGIGTTSPGAKLDVIGSVRSFSSAGNYGLITNGSFQAVGNHGGTFMLDLDNTGEADLVNIKKSGVSRFYIKNDGNIGIGTTDPIAKFEMFGGEMAIKLSANTTSSFQWKNSSGTKIQEIRYDDSDGSMTLGGVGGYPIKFITSNTEKVRIAGDGNVGIGTTSPSVKLHVVGVISGSSFSGAGTGLTGTAASLTAGTATNATQLGGVAAASYVTLNDTQSLTNKTITGTFTGALTGNASTATALTSMNISQFTNNSLYQYHRGDITSLSSSATNVVQPLGTFDGSNITNAPTSGWYNYLSSTHGSYLTSLIANLHRSSDWYVGYKEGPGGTPTNPSWFKLLHSGNYSSYTNLTASWATNAVTALNVGNGTITIAAGTGVGVGTTNTFTTNQSGATTVTISNSGVTSNVAGSGISVSGATGAVTITNSGVTSAVAGTGVGVSAATGAVTFSIGQAVGTGNTPTFAGLVSNGNVGIGSTNPSALLNIRASAPTSIGGTPTGTNLLIDSNTSNYITFRNTADNGTYAGLIFLDNNVGGYIAFGNAGAAVGSDSMIYGAYQDHIFQNGYVNENLYNRTETMRIKQNGNVGIGTSNPIYKFQVVGSAYVNAGTLLIDSGNSISWGNSTQYIFGSNGIGLSFAAGSATRMFVSSSGNIGIGTTNPTATLQVGTNSISATNNNSVNVRIGQSNAAGAIYGLSLANTATATVSNESALSFIVAGNYSATGMISTILRNTTTAASDLVFTNYNNALFERMRIQFDGNVGIGTTSPAYKLDVNGTFNATGTATLAGVSITGTINSSATETIRINNNSGYISIYNSAGTTRTGYLQGNTGNSVILAAENSAVIQFNVNGALRTTIDTSGNVGIGTSVPGQKLDVEGRIRTRGATGTGGFEIGAATTGTAKWRIEWDSASDSLDFNWVG